MSLSQSLQLFTERALLLLFRALARLPLCILHAMGAGVGWLVYGASPSYRRKVRHHVRLALPGAGPAGVRRLGVQSSVQAGRALFELPFLWGRPTAEGAGTCTKVFGWQHIVNAQAQGKGLIFLTPHMGSFECTAQIYAQKHPITVLYRPNRKPFAEKLIQVFRARPQLTLAPTNRAGVKALLRALRANQAVGLLPDQIPSAGEGIWADFFNAPAYTMVLPARLHMTTGAPIVLAVGLRLPMGQGFEVHFFPGPSIASDSLDKQADILAGNQALSNGVLSQLTQSINHALEDLVKQYPEQYYWAYDRYRKP